MNARSLTLRTLLIVTAVVVALASSSALAFVASGPHVTHKGATSASLSVSLASTGDAGDYYGNRQWETSPVLPAPPVGFGGWFNQPVRLSEFTIHDTVDGDNDVAYSGGTWSVNGGTAHAFTGSPVASTQGVYGITATGTDESAEATGTIDSAFGIDMTKPLTWTDAVPVYSKTATVTIMATDALSGVESLQYSVDGGPWDYSWDAGAPATLTVPVTFGPGHHTLWWHAFDNAGNIDSGSTSFAVRAAGFAPTVTLKAQPLAGPEPTPHFVVFSGSVSAMPKPMTLKITVQRKVNNTWKYVRDITTVLPQYATNYSLTRKIVIDGTYRAIAMEGLGVSSWKTFVIQ